MTFQTALNWILSLNQNDWGFAATIVGTALSGWSLYAIGQVRKAYTARQRLPDLLSALKKETNKISSLLVSAGQLASQGAQFRESVMVTRSLALSIKQKVLSKQSRIDTKYLISQIDRAKKKEWSHDEAFELFIKARSLCVAIDHEIKDLKA